MRIQDAIHILTQLSREAFETNQKSNPFRYSEEQLRIQELEIEEATRILQLVEYATTNFLSLIPQIDSRFHIEQMIHVLIPNVDDSTTYENLYTKLRGLHDSTQITAILTRLAKNSIISVDGKKGDFAGEICYPHIIKRISQKGNPDKWNVIEEIAKDE